MIVFEGLAEERNVSQQREDKENGVFDVDLVEAEVAKESDTENGGVDKGGKELEGQPEKGEELGEEAKAADGSVHERAILVEADPVVFEEALEFHRDGLERAVHLEIEQVQVGGGSVINEAYPV